MNPFHSPHYRYPITVNKKLGFIDYQGNEVIPPIHTPPPGANGLTGFYDDVAWVFKNEQYTLIDIVGNELFRCDFDNVHIFSKGFAKVQIFSGLGKGLLTYDAKHRGLINKTGEFVIPPYFDNLFDWYNDFILVIQKGLWGTIDHSGKTIIQPRYHNLTTVSQDEVTRFIAATNKDKKISLLTLQGQPLTGFIYDEIGLSIVNNRLLFKRNNRYGYLDQHLHEIIPPRYDQAYEFAEGFARVANHSRYGCINTQGELIIPMNYVSFYGFSEGLAAVKEAGEPFGYINTENKFVIEPIYDEALWFNNGLAKVKLNGEESYINQQQQALIPFKQYHFLLIENSIITFNLGRKYGFYGLDGMLLIPPEYKSARPENGLIKTEDGYLNYQGDLVWIQPTLPEPQFNFTSFKGDTLNPSWVKQLAAEKYPDRKFNNPLAESEITKIEQQYRIQLPAEYRKFLLQVGDGGPGPLDGLDELKDSCNRSFKLDEAFIPSEISEEERDFFNKPGILLICTDSIVYTFGLVTSGPETGTIWFSDSRYWFPYTPVFWDAINYYDDYDTAADYLVKNQLKIPRMRFNDWYSEWLQSSD